MNLAFRIYLGLISKLSDWKRGKTPKIPPLNEAVLWFHGASIGELESLWLYVQKALSDQNTVIITVFSPSGLDRLPALVEALGPSEGKIHFLGLLPSGHALLENFQNLRVEAFSTTHYELWPELLFVLSKSKTKLNIVDATLRPSLRLAFFIAKCFQFQLPTLKLQSTSHAECERLKLAFKGIKPNISLIPHPRRAWILEKSKRLDHVTHPHTVGVLGNLWPSDWRQFGELWLTWLEQDASHRLMVVPHELKLVPWFLDTLPKHLTNTQEEVFPLVSSITILNAYGKLLHAYSLASWSYVGGGKERGTHSVLEPLTLGIPTSAVPYRLKMRDPRLILICKKRDMIDYLASPSK